MLQIYNTLSRQKEPFETVVPGKVGIYLCGPTVYKEAHIGHMVGPVIFDTVKRYLLHSGYDVNWVVNITDVDDKLIAEATRRDLSMKAVAEEMTADYLKNLAALGVDQIDSLPKATDSIDEIIALIESLIDKDFAYESEGDVFFDVAKDTQYGKLSNRSPEDQQGEGGGAAARKRSPSDFALWKRAKEGEPSWKSPWGQGRPGWHIECSAMSRQLLGESFDIHGGGLDLIFPHHENEIAQSECCHGKPMARYWMHNGLMRASTATGKVGGRGDRQPTEEATIDTKISRSKGAGGLADLIAERGGEVIRFFLLRTQYRSTIVFGDEGLEEAQIALETFHRLFERYERITNNDFYELAPTALRTEGEFDTAGNPLLEDVSRLRSSFLEKMDDDFNTGAAMSELFELVRAINKFADQHDLESPSAQEPAAMDPWQQAIATLRELSALLGLFRQRPKAAGGDDQLAGQLMELLIQLRATARENKDFAMADQIRDSLTELGITIEDRKEGTGWRVD